MSSLYEIFWFYTQFYLKPEDRRPYTYLIRDIYHKAPLVVITLGAIAFYLMGRYTTQISIVVFVGVVSALIAGEILGHCFWGKVYKPDQQEHPTYLGED